MNAKLQYTIRKRTLKKALDDKLRKTAVYRQKAIDDERRADLKRLTEQGQLRATFASASSNLRFVRMQYTSNASFKTTVVFCAQIRDTRRQSMQGPSRREMMTLDSVKSVRKPKQMPYKEKRRWKHFVYQRRGGNRH